MAIAPMVVAGVTGLALVLLDREVALATSVLGQPLPGWFFARPGRVWLVLQAVLVIVSVVNGWMFQLFSLMAIGILAGLVFVTPVGLQTMLPALLLLVLVLPRLNLFWEFRPRWRGPGPPLPGPWR